MFQLNEIGLDLKFSMQHMLLKELMEALFDCRDQLVAAARQRAAVCAIKLDSFLERVILSANDYNQHNPRVRIGGLHSSQPM